MNFYNTRLRLKGIVDILVGGEIFVEALFRTAPEIDICTEFLRGSSLAVDVSVFDNPLITQDI
jgi:hypothetical protein